VAWVVQGGLATDAMVVGRTPTAVLAGASSSPANVIISQTMAAAAAADASLSRGIYTLDGGGVDVARLALGEEILLGAFQGGAGLNPQLQTLHRTTVFAVEASPLGLTVLLRLHVASNIWAVCLADPGAILANNDNVGWLAIY